MLRKHEFVLKNGQPIPNFTNYRSKRTGKNIKHFVTIDGKEIQVTTLRAFRQSRKRFPDGSFVPEGESIRKDGQNYYLSDGRQVYTSTIYRSPSFAKPLRSRRKKNNPVKTDLPVAPVVPVTPVVSVVSASTQDHSAQKTPLTSMTSLSGDLANIDQHIKLSQSDITVKKATVAGLLLFPGPPQESVNPVVNPIPSDVVAAWLFEKP